MFFDPADYLEADPAQTDSAREAERLRREAAQRAKLCEATTRLAAEGGLEAAAIHTAARQAGVGQGTYYKLYDNRDACLREAFKRCAGTVLARVEEAVARGGSDVADRLEAGLRELLGLLDAHPEVARLLLVQILAGDHACRVSREHWLGRFAGLLACEPRTGGVPESGSPAWMAGAALANVLALRLENGEPPGEGSEELIAVGSWPQGVEATMRTVGTSGRGRSASVEATRRKRRAARRARTRKAQRERIVEAMGELAGTKGYRGTRVAEVLRRAEVSSPVFYAHFSGKEACLAAAFDAAVESIHKQVERAVQRTETCEDRAEAGLRALVESLASRPETARLATIEIRAAGTNGEERFEESVNGFAQLIADGEPGEVARMTARAI